MAETDTAAAPRYDGTKMKRMMWARGWTVQELADRTDYSRTRVSAFLNEHDEVSEKFAYLASLAFEVELDELRTRAPAVE